VTTRPVKAVKAWLQAAGISEGPLFRPVAKGGRLNAERLTDQSVCSIVKASADRIGLKAADFGAHSLRAGFRTSAARRGASVLKASTSSAGLLFAFFLSTDQPKSLFAQIERRECWHWQ
jgi:integrase